MSETINYCPGCGQHVKYTYNFCPSCGRCLRNTHSVPTKPISPYFDPTDPFNKGPWMVGKTPYTPSLSFVEII